MLEQDCRAENRALVPRMRMVGVHVRMSYAVPGDTDMSRAELKKPRKPYQKPSFRYERVFETMALACGKISPSQPQCRFNRKWAMR